MFYQNKNEKINKLINNIIVAQMQNCPQNIGFELKMKYLMVFEVKYSEKMVIRGEAEAIILMFFGQIQRNVRALDWDLDLTLFQTQKNYFAQYFSDTNKKMN